MRVFVVPLSQLRLMRESQKVANEKVSLARVENEELMKDFEERCPWLKPGLATRNT